MDEKTAASRLSADKWARNLALRLAISAGEKVGLSLMPFSKLMACGLFIRLI